MYDINDIRLTDEELDNFREAGRIAAKIREESKKLIMIGGSVSDTIETIEQMILDEGVGVGFPVNVCINEIAAHYTTPIEGTDREFTENDVVKVDLGTEVNLCVGDTAYTIDLSGKYEKLLEASENALNEAIKMAKPGVSVDEIGKKIEETITKHGFKPIRNLTGHKILPGALHAGASLPNVGDAKENYTLKEGDVFACEPFATNGNGFVKDEDEVNIFSFAYPVETNKRHARKIMEIMQKRIGLPVSERWLYKEIKSKLLVKSGLKELLMNQAIVGYPILKEEKNGIVSQFEHTFIVTENGAEIITK